MVKASTRNRVHRALATHLGIDERAIEDSQSLADDLGLDGFDVALVAVRLEDIEPFRGDLPVELLDAESTVGELVAMVETWLDRDPVDDDRITLPGAFAQAESGTWRVDRESRDSFA